MRKASLYWEDRMPEHSLAFKLLSLFTTAERAAEIEGDLIEESIDKSRWWLLGQVAGITWALFVASCRQAPGRIAVLGIAATSLSVLFCKGLDTLFFANGALFPASHIGLMLIPVAAFLTGFLLGRFWAGRGLSATVLATILLTCLFILSQGEWISEEIAPGLISSFKMLLTLLWYYAVAVGLYLLPLMYGGLEGNKRFAHQ